VVYCYLDDLSAWAKRRFLRGTQQAVPVPLIQGK